MKGLQRKADVKQTASSTIGRVIYVDGSSVTVQAESAFKISDYKYKQIGKEDRSIFKLTVITTTAPAVSNGGSKSGTISVNTAVGSSPVTTNVVQEQTITSLYNYQ